jgi:hypothetical protein
VKKSSPSRQPARRRHAGTPLWLHALPAGLLALAVLGVMGIDLATAKRGGNVGPGTDSDAAGSWDYDVKQLVDKRPRLGVQFNNDNHFGVVMLDAHDPENKDAYKKLTYDIDGSKNNTVVKIDGAEHFFGYRTADNVWVGPKRVEVPKPRHGWVSKMRFRGEQVLVTQHVEIVPGKTGFLDTCLVYYAVRNQGTLPHKVGLRILLDTYIGDNDGVPFTIPGRKGFVTTKEDLAGDQVPDYIEVVERPNDAENPGTMARLALKGIRLPGIELTEPDRLCIGRFPGARTRWDWRPQDMTDKEGGAPDSAVAIYWPYKELEPKETRHMAFTYGLSQLDIGDRLVVSAPSSVVPGREFVITCYVYNSSQGQKVKLDLPEGLALASGEKEEKVVDEAAARTQVFWRVKADKEGKFPVAATSGRGRSRATQVIVKLAGIFG